MISKKTSILISLFLVGAILCFVVWKTSSPLFPSLKSDTRLHVEINIKALHDIDTLYTGFFLIPLIDESTGTLKRDMLNTLIGKKAEEKVLGVCQRTFEVSIGYEHLNAMMMDENIVQNICTKKYDAIPGPTILDINGTEMKTYGAYNGSCYAWDKDRDSLKQKIEESLKSANIYDDMAQRSKKSLESIVSILCR